MVHTRRNVHSVTNRSRCVDFDKRGTTRYMCFKNIY